LFSGEAPWRDLVKEITLEAGSRSQTFKITSLKSEKNPFTLKVDGINDRTMAEFWSGSLGFIDGEFMKTSPGETVYLRELLGFAVVVGEKEVGVVRNFETNNSQDILVVDKGGKDVLIPLIKEFIVSLNHETKQIIMELPPGLLEVNE
jgi:16S rRNA processing protein RimM